MENMRPVKARPRGQAPESQQEDFLSQKLKDDLTSDLQEPCGVGPVVDFYKRGISDTERGRHRPEVTQHVRWQSWDLNPCNLT